MISYAQNGEDVVLARAFAGRADGFYVDVGAGHPVIDSVTKHFSDLGWRGINVEPLAEELALLTQHRPRDVNLGTALADRAGEAQLFAGPSENRGSSTLDQSLADEYRSRGERFEERTVPLSTLQAVLDEHASGTVIDFLKIDVEGYEEPVLRGVDLGMWRPRVVVVEATLPNSKVPSHEAWEPLLATHGYEHVLFDGLNRFYVRKEDRDELVDTLSAPANVLDDFVPFRFSAQDASVLGRELHATQDAVDDLRDEVIRLEQAAEAARCVAAQESLRRVVAERDGAEAIRELAALRATATYRYSARLRRLYGAVLRRRPRA